VIDLDTVSADALERDLRRALAGHRTADQIYDAACSLLRERLGEEALVAIYVADGDVLTLRAQRGYVQAINWLLPDWGCFGAAYRMGSTMHLESNAGDEDIFPKVEMSDSIIDQPLELAQTALAMKSAESASIETRVRVLHPDWSESEVASEVLRIQDEVAAAAPPVTLSSGQFGDPEKDSSATGNLPTTAKSGGGGGKPPTPPPFAKRGG